jgi:hypothetical protein
MTLEHYTLHLELDKEFKVGKSVHNHSIPINQPTRCNNFLGLLLDVYVRLNNISGVLTPITRSLTTAVAATGFTVGAWW